jgi:hypothetical protein
MTRASPENTYIFDEFASHGDVQPKKKMENGPHETYLMLVTQTIEIKNKYTSQNILIIHVITQNFFKLALL